MKIVIDIPRSAYTIIKEWNKQDVATYEESIIANGTPYEEKPIVEKIVTKGGMTLALRKPDREISDLANVIADMLDDITIRELKDKFNTITFSDTNTGCIVNYYRVDEKEVEE